MKNIKTLKLLISYDNFANHFVPFPPVLCSSKTIRLRYFSNYCPWSSNQNYSSFLKKSPNFWTLLTWYHYFSLLPWFSFITLWHSLVGICFIFLVLCSIFISAWGSCKIFSYQHFLHSNLGMKLLCRDDALFSILGDIHHFIYHSVLHIFL